MSRWRRGWHDRPYVPRPKLRKMSAATRSKTLEQLQQGIRDSPVLSAGGRCLYAVHEEAWGAFTIKPNQSASIEAAVHTAWHLADGLGLDLLTKQLASLDRRLRWIQGKDGVVGAELWDEPGMVGSCRLQVASQILKNLDHEEAEFYLYRHSQDLEQVADIAEPMGWSVSELRARQVPVDRARLIAAIGALAEGRWGHVWEQLVELQSAELITALTTRMLQYDPPPQRPRRRAVARIVDRLLRQDGIDGLAALLELIASRTGMSKPHVRQILDRVSVASTWDELCLALRMCVSLSELEAGTSVVRRIGRLLRRGTVPDTSVVRLLGTIRWNTVEPARSLCAPLTAYVTRPDADPDTAIDNLWADRAPGLVGWYLANVDRLGVSHVWERRIQQFMREVEWTAPLSVLRTALFDGPATLEDFMMRVEPMSDRRS